MNQYETLKRAHIKACKQKVQRVYTHNEMAIAFREVDRVNEENEELKKAFDLAMSMVTKYALEFRNLERGRELLSGVLHEIPVVRRMICESCERKGNCGDCVL